MTFEVAAITLSVATSKNYISILLNREFKANMIRSFKNLDFFSYFFKGETSDDHPAPDHQILTKQLINVNLLHNLICI